MSATDAELRVVAAELASRISDHPFYTWQPHKKQLLLMKSNARIRVAFGGNRTGKSDVCHRIAVERFFGWSPVLTRETGQLVAWPGKQAVWVSALDSNVSRDVSEDKIAGFIPRDEHRHLGWNGTDRVWTDRRTGSTLGFKSADSGRGKYQGTSRNLIVLDEEHHEDIFNECYARTIDCRGQIVMAFTALEGMKWLHKLLFGSPDLDLFKVAMGMVDNPHLPPEEIAAARLRYSGDELKIRVEGEFLLRIGQPFFAPDDIDRHQPATEDGGVTVAAVSRQGRWRLVKDTTGKITVFETAKQGRNYAIGVDVSAGKAAGDYSCMQVLDTATWKQVAVWHGHTDPGLLGEEAIALAKVYNNALLAIEVNNHGLATQTTIERLGYGHLYRRTQEDRVNESGKVVASAGFYTDRRTKAMVLNLLKDAVRDNNIKIHDAATLEEMRYFGYLTEEPAAAVKGGVQSYGLGAVMGNDDRVMALAIALAAAYQSGAGAPDSSPLPGTIVDAIMDDVHGSAPSVDYLADALGLDEYDDGGLEFD